MSYDELNKKIRDNNNWMQSASGEDREENSYLVISNIPDVDGECMFQGLVMYLKSERKGNDVLYATRGGDNVCAETMQKYKTSFSFCFPYTPQELLTVVPDVLRERKIICYDSMTSYAPLRIMLASNGIRYEMSNEFVDVKEEAKIWLGPLPDYELDTIIGAIGFVASDFEDDDFGSLMKIKCAYEKFKEYRDIIDQW